MNDSKTTWYCVTCGTSTETDSSRIPAGWFGINRSRGAEERYKPFGIYCSVECIEHRLKWMYNREADGA